MMKTDDTEVLDLSKQIDKIMLEMSQADKQIKELNENLMAIQNLITSEETNSDDTGATTSKATQDGKERSRTKSESTSPITSFFIIIAVTLLLLLLLLFNKSIAELDDSVILPPI